MANLSLHKMDILIVNCLIFWLYIFFCHDKIGAFQYRLCLLSPINQQCVACIRKIYFYPVQILVLQLSTTVKLLDNGTVRFVVLAVHCQQLQCLVYQTHCQRSSPDFQNKMFCSWLTSNFKLSIIRFWFLLSMHIFASVGLL